MTWTRLLSPAAAFVAAALFVGCPSASEETVAVADQQQGVKTKAVDLNALAAARAASEGNAIEDELVEARAMNANVKAYANKEGEPTLDDIKAAGAKAAPGTAGYDPFAEGSNAGSQAPSDLDTLDDEGGATPWINMQLVEQRILGKSKSMQACWDNHGGGSGGRMDMAVTVGTKGRATSVGMTNSSPLKNGQVASCVARAMKSVKYPEPRNGAVSFVYPVKF
ncbi:MAG: AgmX/PglI C-terminal domain-containing protein [Deltaproteobacteria bacterium]|nr:AgmX/PglI C-terminal domain-containing protein [Deltaproteobacteria bacterium]